MSTTHLSKLAAIGERPAGSPANHQAAAYIHEVFTQSGLQTDDVRVDFPGWSTSECILTSRGKSFSIEANPFSPACDITAQAISVCTISELESADLSDKIVLLYGELSSTPIFPVGFTIYNPERDQTINRLLREKAPKAILTVNPQSPSQLHIIEDDNMPFPSATIPADVALELLKQSDIQVTLKLDTEQKLSHSITLIGRQSVQTRSKIVLCAHYDTKFGTPGAYDNASGLSVLLTLAETLAPRQFAVDLEFVAWGDEEYGGHSDSIYAKNANYENMLCAINLDGIGQYTGTNTITMLAQSKDFQQAIAGITQNYPGIVWVEPWYASNHYSYFARNVPSIAIGSVGVNLVHQAHDTIDWISPAKLEEVVRMVTAIVEHTQHKSLDWSRP